jgi:hypothetical protein
MNTNKHDSKLYLYNVNSGSEKYALYSLSNKILLLSVMLYNGDILLYINPYLVSNFIPDLVSNIDISSLFKFSSPKGTVDNNMSLCNNFHDFVPKLANFTYCSDYNSNLYSLKDKLLFNIKLSIHNFNPYLSVSNYVSKFFLNHHLLMPLLPMIIYTGLSFFKKYSCKTINYIDSLIDGKTKGYSWLRTHIFSHLTELQVFTGRPTGGTPFEERVNMHRRLYRESRRNLQNRQLLLNSLILQYRNLLEQFNATVEVFNETIYYGGILDSNFHITVRILEGQIRRQHSGIVLDVIRVMRFQSLVLNNNHNYRDSEFPDLISMNYLNALVNSILYPESFLEADIIEAEKQIYGTRKKKSGLSGCEGLLKRTRD